MAFNTFRLSLVKTTQSVFVLVRPIVNFIRPMFAAPFILPTPGIEPGVINHVLANRETIYDTERTI